LQETHEDLLIYREAAHSGIHSRCLVVRLQNFTMTF
jgi:hypothetical protein